MGQPEARMESAVEGAFPFALLGGGVGLAGGVGLYLGLLLLGLWHLWPLIIAFVIGGFVGGFVTGLVAREGVGGFVEFVVGGSRGRTRSEYSHAQALVARGAYGDAVAEYRAAADADPADAQALATPKRGGGATP